VPTIAELGYPEFDSVIYFPLAVPAATPSDIASLLEHEVQRALKSPDLQQRLVPLDIKIVPSTSAEATAPHRVRCKFVGQAGQGDRDACRLTAPMSFAAPDVTKNER